MNEDGLPVAGGCLERFPFLTCSVPKAGRTVMFMKHLENLDGLNNALDIKINAHIFFGKQK